MTRHDSGRGAETEPQPTGPRTHRGLPRPQPTTQEDLPITPPYPGSALPTRPPRSPQAPRPGHRAAVGRRESPLTPRSTKTPRPGVSHPPFAPAIPRPPRDRLQDLTRAAWQPHTAAAGPAPSCRPTPARSPTTPPKPAPPQAEPSPMKEDHDQTRAARHQPPLRPARCRHRRRRRLPAPDPHPHPRARRRRRHQWQLRHRLQRQRGEAADDPRPRLRDPVRLRRLQRRPHRRHPGQRRPPRPDRHRVHPLHQRHAQGRPHRPQLPLLPTRDGPLPPGHRLPSTPSSALPLRKAPRWRCVLTPGAAPDFLGAAAAGSCAWTPGSRSRDCSTALPHCGCGRRSRNGMGGSGTP